MVLAEASLNVASAPSYLEALNSKQQQAVLHSEGPLLILAGAGTGKTRVLTTRLAHILERNLCGFQNILAVTFTNKAALEMRERIQRLLGRSVDGMWLGTFHSLSMRILRKNADALGYSSNFTIIDSKRLSHGGTGRIYDACFFERKNGFVASGSCGGFDCFSITKSA